MIDYIVNKTQQIAVQAENPEQAIEMCMAGKGTVGALNISVNVRPPSPQPRQTPPAPIVGIGPRPNG